MVFFLNSRHTRHRVSLWFEKGTWKNLAAFEEGKRKFVFKCLWGACITSRYTYTHTYTSRSCVCIAWRALLCILLVSVMQKGWLLWCVMDGCCFLEASQRTLRPQFCHRGIRSCEFEQTCWLSQTALLLTQQRDCFGLCVGECSLVGFIGKR